MSIAEYFAATYTEARTKFLNAAADASISPISYLLPHHKGPNKEDLTIDVAQIGPSDATSLVVVVSGVHGVEGFCGSGCQVGFLKDQLHKALPNSTAVILVHALNPYGFAWLRRVNEDNVDLNRNFQDFSRALPSSEAYKEIHDWLVPRDWEGPSRLQADNELKKYIAKHGLSALQAAVSGGQYLKSDGLFYGGARESWSAKIFKQLLRERMTSSVQTLVVLDLHTGLGPAGYGEPIFIGDALAEYLRVKAWYGPEVTSPNEGNAATAPVTGTLAQVVRSIAGNITTTYLAIEYGTIALMDVLTALRADNWLHEVAKRQNPLYCPIKRQIRDAFYVDQLWWKAAVYGRWADLMLRTARGLST